MHRSITLTSATDERRERSLRWLSAVRDDVAEIAPTTIDELLDFAQVLR
ncbi:hypothetical protein [Gordonia sp. (in: high G+C Gram-positive bacteria)]